MTAAVPLPSGLVSFAFTDIEGSTRLLREHPGEYPTILERHREVLRAAWHRFDGAEVGTEGDGMLVAFADATNAVLACVQAQRGLHSEVWPAGAVVRVRIGIHTGLAEARGGDYVAMAVHQAARVAAVAEGGQVLATQGTISAASPESWVKLIDLGRFRVRDFDGPIDLWLATASDLPEPSRHVRATPAEHHNLPLPQTAIVGRESDITAIQAALAPRRVISIVGPGGVGKSRLAVEIGRDVHEEWPDGVWRLAVDELAETSHLVGGIAELLGVPLSAPADDVALAEALDDRRCLLLLDGCERALDPVGSLVSVILSSCPGVGVLTTSREPVHLRGETVYRLGPLATGTVSNASEAHDLASVELFVDRARQANPDFDLTDQNAAAVSALAERLDGLPLALEVAASLTQAYSIQDMLDGFDTSFASLRSRDRTLPSRQRSLDALLSWSERLLSPDERVVFHRLSIFESTFTIAAARAVASVDPVPEMDVVDHLWSLVDRSLIVADTSSGETRYRMLGLVRRYARAQLAESPELTQIAGRAISWFHHRIGPQHVADRRWIGRLGADLENLRWLVEHLIDLEIDREIGLEPVDSKIITTEVAASILRYRQAQQRYRSGIDEGLRWCRRLPPSTAKVGLLTALADLLLRVDDVGAARAAVEEAAAMRSHLGAPRWDEVGVERALGEISNRSGSPERTVALANTALQRVTDGRSRARLSNMLGNAYVISGDLLRAADAFGEELSAVRSLGDELLLTRAEANAAEIALRLGRHQEAAAHQRASLDLAVALGQPVFVAYAVVVSVQVAAITPAETVSLLTCAVDLLAESQHQLYEDDAARLRRMLAEAEAAMGSGPYREAQAAGHGLQVDAAARRADELLATVAGTERESG